LYGESPQTYPTDTLGVLSCSRIIHYEQPIHPVLSLSLLPFVIRVWEEMLLYFNFLQLQPISISYLQLPADSQVNFLRQAEEPTLFPTFSIQTYFPHSSSSTPLGIIPLSLKLFSFCSFLSPSLKRQIFNRTTSTQVSTFSFFRTVI